jgi:transcriptional regulator with XRE-family HTH domain
MPISGKTGVIEKHPNSKTVKFGGRFISIRAIARAQGVDKGYISRVFQGKRGLTLDGARKLAAILAMDLNTFCEALDNSIDEYNKVQAILSKQLESRLDKEVTEDLKTFAAGSIAAPRLPSISPSIR